MNVPLFFFSRQEINRFLVAMWPKPVGTPWLNLHTSKVENTKLVFKRFYMNKMSSSLVHASIAERGFHSATESTPRGNYMRHTELHIIYIILIHRAHCDKLHQTPLMHYITFHANSSRVSYRSTHEFDLISSIVALQLKSTSDSGAAVHLWNRLLLTVTFMVCNKICTSVIGLIKINVYKMNDSVSIKKYCLCMSKLWCKYTWKIKLVIYWHRWVSIFLINYQ